MQGQTCGAAVAVSQGKGAIEVGRGAAAVHAAGDSSSILNPAVRYIFFTFIERPLLQVYLYGPAFQGYGFWGGMETEVICNVVTNVSVDHWREHTAECAELVYSRFESYMVVVYAVIYFVTLIQSLVACYRRCTHKRTRVTEQITNTL